MLHDPTARRGLRLLLILAVAGSLLAACGDDDSSNAGDDTEADGGDATTSTEGDSGDDGGDGGAGLANDLCNELPADDVSEVTGLELDKVEGDAGSCTYQSDGGHFIALAVTDVDGVSNDLIMQGARSGCGSEATDIDVGGADDAFTCESSSVTIVGAVGNGILAVASGADMSGESGDLVGPLTKLMELAISRA